MEPRGRVKSNIVIEKSGWGIRQITLSKLLEIIKQNFHNDDLFHDSLCSCMHNWEYIFKNNSMQLEA